jgi:hypothetical protein
MYIMTGKRNDEDKQKESSNVINTKNETHKQTEEDGGGECTRRNKNRE